MELIMEEDTTNGLLKKKGKRKQVDLKIIMLCTLSINKMF